MQKQEKHQEYHTLLIWGGFIGSGVTILSTIYSAFQLSQSHQMPSGKFWALQLGTFLMLFIGLLFWMVWLLNNNTEIVRSLGRETINLEKRNANHRLIVRNLKRSQRAAYGKRKRKEEVLTEKFREILRLFSELDHLADNAISELYNTIELDVAYAKFESSYLLQLEKILNETCTLFGTISKRKCAVCVKFLVTKDDQISLKPNAERLFDKVSTLQRDEYSSVHRNYDDDDTYELQAYPYVANTAFKKILESETVDIWAADDLNAMGANYQNRNPTRQSLYNATLVAAIRNPVTRTNENNFILGFVCVDNIGGGLDNSLAKNTLGILSYLMYNYFRKFSEFNEFLTEEGEMRYAEDQQNTITK